MDHSMLLLLCKRKPRDYRGVFVYTTKGLSGLSEQAYCAAKPSYVKLKMTCMNTFTRNGAATRRQKLTTMPRTKFTSML